jgi:CubicO group peptidase (beta-lactamase class C family)
MSPMKVLSKVNVTSVLVAFSLVWGLTIFAASADPMHTPTKMPMAEAESVGMSTEGLKRIDEMMQEHIDAGHIQGGATIVARRGKVVHFSTHGEIDVANGRAMEPDAIYLMASSAKPVIGVATMMLVDEGLLSLSDPLSRFIPEFADLQVAVAEEEVEWDDSKDKGKGKDEWTEEEIAEWLEKNKDKLSKDDWGEGKGDGKAEQLVPANTPVTIHHLLTHTSGMTGGGIQIAPDDTLASYVPKVAKAPLRFQPGTRWMYGNVTIHTILPRIIEIASEMPFNEFMQKRVFEPLEMNNSYFNLPSDKESKRVVLEGFDKKSKKGWGGLSSAAEDFLHFEQMLLNGGELFGRRLLSPESVKLFGSNQVGDLFAKSGKGPKAQPGMGFGYTVAVTLDPIAAGNYRGTGAFGWGGVAGTVSWTDPENELVAVMMLQQPRVAHFGKVVYEALLK